MVALRGGDRLEAKLAELSKNVEKAARVRVGFLENARYDDGTSVAMVAAINEFGQTSIHPNQPPRPFFRRMINEKSPEWPKAVGALLVEHNYDAAITLAETGEAIVGQLQQSIDDFTSPPLSPITIARKGFTKPLIDTGKMWNSVAKEVE